jgi:AcrR family transcriptional regulator
MPYEVIKRVGKRAYRYQVSAYRDPQTGKSKGRWRYLGRAGAADTSERATRGGSTAERLLDAFARLIAERSYAATTVDAIARRAKVTHATFYRHFKNKRALFFAHVQRTRDELDPAAAFKAGHDPAVEHERIKGFLRRVISHPAIRSGIARAVYEMQFKDPAIGAFWLRFVREREAIWREYISGLNENGVGHGDDPRKLAAVLTIVAEGLRQRVALEGPTVTDEEVDLWGEVIARVLIR